MAAPMRLCAQRLMLVIQMLLSLAPLATPQDSIAPAGAPGFQASVEGGCPSPVVFYFKTFFNLSQPGTQPATANCMYLGQEEVPAAYFGTGGGGGPNVTLGTCLWWPGVVEPGSAALGPSPALPVWQVAATLADGRALRYAAADERFYTPLGQACGGPAELGCFSFQRVEGGNRPLLTCTEEEAAPLAPPPPPAPPSNATSFQLEVANNCLQSPAVSAAKWYYTDDVVPPPEGSPACRVRGTDAEGSYCMAYWLGVGPASTAAVVSTTVPQWYFTAYLSEDFNAYWGEDVYLNLSGQPCGGFNVPGCAKWSRLGDVPDPAPVLAAPLTCSTFVAGAPYPPAPLRPPPAPPTGPQTGSSDASGPAPAPPPPPVEAASSDSTGSGVIIGAAVGAVAGLAAVGALVLVAVRRRRRRPAAALQSVSVKGAGVQDDWLVNSKSDLSAWDSEAIKSDALLSHLFSRPRTSPNPSATPATASQASSGTARSLVSSGGGGRMAAAAGGGGLEGLPASAAARFDEFQFQKCIGEGSYGRVYLAMWRETQVAVKILLGGDGGADASDWERALALDDVMLGRLKEEARIMMALRHTNVLQIFGVCPSPPAIVSEYCARGSLTDVLRAARERPADLPWRRRLELAIGAARGMLVLHASTPPIVHRDLKSPNLLVDAHWVVKVSDFNLSRILGETARSQSSQAAMNPRWLAPEVMRGGAATPAADVFSFGVVLWELLTWQLPWVTGDGNAWHIVGAVMAGRRPAIPAREELPGEDTAAFQGLEAYVALLQRCWAQAPEERPNFQQVARELREMLEAEERHAAAHS